MVVTANIITPTQKALKFDETQTAWEKYVCNKMGSDIEIISCWIACNTGKALDTTFKLGLAGFSQKSNEGYYMATKELYFAFYVMTMLMEIATNSDFDTKANIIAKYDLSSMAKKLQIIDLNCSVKQLLTDLAIL